MPTNTISAVLADLFSAPLKAVVDAEVGYREAWAKWLEMQKALLVEKDGKYPDSVNLTELLKTAPVVSLDGVIELAISMRIASVKERSVGLGVSVGVGPVYATGSFGMTNRSTEESTFQAHAKFTISNTERNLGDLLKERGLTPTDPASLTTAIEKLKAPIELAKVDTKP